MEKQGRKSTRSPGRGTQMSKSGNLPRRRAPHPAVGAVGAGDGTALPGPGWGRAGRSVSWPLVCTVSERSDLLPHLGAGRPGSASAPGLLADAWDGRPPAGLHSPWPLSSSEPPSPSSGLLQRAFSELAGSTGLTLGIPRREALDADSHCWLLFIDPDQHGPLCATDAGHVCNVQFSSSHI